MSLMPPVPIPGDLLGALPCFVGLGLEGRNVALGRSELTGHLDQLALRCRQAGEEVRHKDSLRGSRWDSLSVGGRTVLTAIGRAVGTVLQELLGDLDDCPAVVPLALLPAAAKRQAPGGRDRDSESVGQGFIGHRSERHDGTRSDSPCDCR
jgi:hypothetical protein